MYAKIIMLCYKMFSDWLNDELQDLLQLLFQTRNYFQFAYICPYLAQGGSRDLS